MSRPARSPNVYLTEDTAKLAAFTLLTGMCNVRSAWLYRLHPSEETPAGIPTFLVSYGVKLRLLERQWIEAQHMTATKLGRFRPNGSYLPVNRSTPNALPGC